MAKRALWNQKVHGGWDASRLSQKGDWTQVIEALDLTEAQRKGAIEILRFIAKGEMDRSYLLSRHAKAAKAWPTRWRSRYEVRRFMEGLARRGLVSARYGWYLLDWLKRNGWVREKAKASKGGRSVMGYALSDEVLRALYRMARSVERFFESPS